MNGKFSNLLVFSEDELFPCASETDSGVQEMKRLLIRLDCPGLPRESQWRAGGRRQQRVQLGVHGQRHEQHELVVQLGGTQSQ